MSGLDYHEDYPWSEYLKTPEKYKPLLEACLLTEIIRRNSRIPFDQGYLDWKRCQDLLRLNPFFRLLLLEAWEFSNFSSIIESSLLRGTNDTSGTAAPSSDIPDISQISNYYGTTHTIVHGDSNTYNSYNFESESRSKMLKSLCARDYNAIQTETYARRVGNTGEWFLYSVPFNIWVIDPMIRTLWCPGIPGVGKTMISSTAVNHLRSQYSYPVCVVYLNYKHQNDQNLRYVLGAILRQLCEANTEVQNIVASSFSADLVWTNRQLLDLLKAACCVLNHVFIIIDALDEFLEFYSQEAVIELQRALDIPCLKLMTTSRVIGSIESVFDSATTVRCEITSDRDDMEQYIRLRISRELSFASGIADEIATKVLEAAKERFLLTELHMSSICRLFTIGHVRSALKNLANQVDLAYGQVLDRIEEQDAPRREIARKTLTLVAYAHRPLYFSDIQLVLAALSGVAEGDDLQDYVYPLDVICACCGGLVLQDSDDQTMRLIHFTAQEFFDRIQESKYPKADLFIVEALMTYACHISTKQVDAHLSQNGVSLYILDYFRKHFRCAERYLFTDLTAIEHVLPRLRFITTWMSKIAVDDLFSNESSRPAEVFGLWNVTNNAGAPVEAVSLDLPVLLSILLESGSKANAVIGSQRHTPLTIAAWCGASRCAELLLEREEVIADWQTAGEMTPLSLAVMTQNKEIVAMLIKHSDVDVNRPVFNGITPLMLAATRYDHSILLALLNAPGVDLNAKDSLNGWTALFYAISKPQPNAVVAILEHDSFDLSANVIEERNDSGDITHLTPLTFAIKNGNETIIRTLLKREQYPIGYRSEGRSLLSFAAEHGIPWLSQELIELEPDTVDLLDNFGRTPFSYSSSAVVSETLLAAGSIQMDLPDNSGRTPLSYAVACGRYAGPPWSDPECEDADCLVRMILERGSINVNSQDSRGRTPLSYAYTSSCTQLLLDHGADVNLADNDGRTPLSWAAEGCNSRIVELLANQENTQVNLVDSTGRTAFSYSLVKDYVNDAGDYLFSKGAIPELDIGLSVTQHEDQTSEGERIRLTPFIKELDVDRPDVDGCTRLLKSSSTATEYFDLFDVYNLIKYGANANAQDSVGRTPLFYIAEGCPDTSWINVWHRVALMHLLLEKGADINAADNGGSTALDYAYIEDIALFLIMRGAVRGTKLSNPEQSDDE